jgi:predicted RNA-binding Zn-ribbon protein involved in translation (DUF1610 family)
MQSFRAEAYGMLSMLLFMVRVLELFELPFPPRVEVYTDNESLINRIKRKQRLRGEEFPNSTLESDWDVVQAILRMIKLFPKVNINHVQGHQDDHEAVHKLSNEAQANVSADEYADKFHKYSSHKKDLVPMIAGTGAQLDTEWGTITSQMKKHIRNMATKEALIEYIAKHEKWDETIHSRIDWESYSYAMRNCKTVSQQFLTKLTMDLLPMGKTVHRYKSYYDHHCPSCGEEHETRSHVLRCRHDTRTPWQNKLLTKVRKEWEEKGTSQVLLAVIVDGLEAWFNDTAFPETRHPPRSAGTHQGSK